MYKASPSKAWRSIKSKYRLVGSKCPFCKSFYYPTASFCSKCQKEADMQMVEFSGKGKIVTYTIVRVAPLGFEELVPYPIAVVQLDEGIRISAQIVDWKEEDLYIGKRVEVTFRKLFSASEHGVIHYGLKFRPY